MVFLYQSNVSSLANAGKNSAKLAMDTLEFLMQVLSGASPNQIYKTFQVLKNDAYAAFIDYRSALFQINIWKRVWPKKGECPVV